MRKQLNFKAVLILTVGGAACATTIHFLHAAQVRHSAHELLEEAKRLEQNGEINLAADCFAQYIALAPSDADAKARLGLMLSKVAKAPQERLRAYLALSKALAADASRDDVRRELAHLAMGLARYAEVREHLAILLEREPENTQLLVLRARCAVMEKEESEAAGWYAKAVESAPRDVDIGVEYATLLRERLNSPIDGVRIVEQMLSATGRTPEARIAAARYFRRFGLLDKAEQALVPEPNAGGARKADELFLAAQLAQDRHQREQARELLLQGWRQFPDDGRFPLELASLELAAGQRDKAQEYLGYALAKWPDQVEQLGALGRLLVELGRHDEAARVIGLLDNKNSRPAADHLRARLLMKQGAWPAAVKLLEKTRNDSRPASEFARFTISLLADCHEQLGNPDQQLVVLRQALQLDPAWLFGQRRLVQVLAASGQIDQAIATLNQIASKAPEDQATLVQLLLRRAERLPSESRDWPAIERLLEELGRGSWDPPAVALMRAQTLAVQGKFAEARQQAEAVRQLDRNQIAPWLLLFALAEKQPMASSGTAVLAEAERQLGPRVEWSLARAQVWLKAAPAARKDMPGPPLELDRFKGTDRNRLLAALGELFSAAGERAMAQRLWTELTEREPNNLRAWFAQLDDALEKQEWDAARRILDQVKRLEGSAGPHALFGAAALRVAQASPADQHALAEARADLARAAAALPSWTRIYLLDALICERQGRPELALERYKAALERGATQLPVVRRVLELMYAQRLFGEAAELLRRFPEQALSSPDLGRLAVQVTLAHADRNGADLRAARRAALERARQAVAADSTNSRDHAWLGQMAALAGEDKEAERALRRACELDGKTPETWLPLVVFLARTDAKRAEAAIEEAKKQLPAEQLPLSLALFHEALGRIQQAGEQYQTALTARPDDAILLRHAATFELRSGQVARAAPFFRRFLATPAATANPGLSAWGRRQLAIALALQGGYQRIQEAQALLEQNRQAAGNSLEDRRIKALVLALSSAHRREAIQLFESLGPPASSERLLLAKLHEASGNWPAAAEQFQILLRNNAKNPAVLGRFVRGLLNQRQTRNASACLDKLTALAPASLDTLDIRVLFLKQAGRNDEAARLVLKYSGGKEPRLDLAARWLETLDRPADAERLLRAFAASSKLAERMLPLARFLGRQKRVAEGLAICDKAWATCDPVPVAVSCVAILRAGGAKQARQVETSIRAAVARHPARLKLRTLLAELEELDGLYDDAMAMHRDILAKDPSNVVALNNLAVLLALRGMDLDEALTLIQKAITLAGPIPQLLDTRSTVYRGQGKLDLALRDLEDAVGNAGTSSPAFYVRLARAQLSADDRGAAQVSHRKALDAGFKVEMLHPLEREDYGKMMKELE